MQEWLFAFASAYFDTCSFYQSQQRSLPALIEHVPTFRSVAMSLGSLQRVRSTGAVLNPLLRFGLTILGGIIAPLSDAASGTLSVLASLLSSTATRNLPVLPSASADFGSLSAAPERCLAI